MPAVVQYVLATEATGCVFVDNCVAYIAGYVCRKLYDYGKVRCGECTEALLSNPDDMLAQDAMRLIKVRDNSADDKQTDNS